MPAPYWKYSRTWETILCPLATWVPSYVGFMYIKEALIHRQILMHYSLSRTWFSDKGSGDRLFYTLLQVESLFVLTILTNLFKSNHGNRGAGLCSCNFRDEAVRMVNKMIQNAESQDRRDSKLIFGIRKILRQRYSTSVSIDVRVLPYKKTLTISRSNFWLFVVFANRFLDTVWFLSCHHKNFFSTPEELHDTFMGAWSVKNRTCSYECRFDGRTRIILRKLLQKPTIVKAFSKAFGASSAFMYW